MNHFEVHLMVLSKVLDTIVLRITIHFEYLFSDKKEFKMAIAMLEILDGFCLVRVLMNLHSKSAPVFQMTLNFELE